ncbi:hypothetical protein [Methylobacterium sp. V23]|uniref:hypothetical protein n=1 Tax=Methylobacterium sp. V23 TaxID=2044878 RepID=UPI000CDA534D|nr:hypothetical protein [Methylobacterium sp. V23]POR40054.1 hypothetical protein CRT23_26000 [Methylobacterium sp. V23]
MEDLFGIPFLALDMDAKGQAPERAQAAAALSLPEITDLIVISHGWNNDMAEARQLYAALFANLAPMLTKVGSTRKFAALGVLWPSKRFAEEDLIPGGKATPAATAALAAQAPSSAEIAAKIDGLATYVGKLGSDDAERAKVLVTRLEDSRKARKDFVSCIRAMLTQPPSDIRDDASDRFFVGDADRLMEGLSNPVTPPAGTPCGAAGGIARIKEAVPTSGHGGAVSFSDVLTGMKAAAFRLLNYATYYEMKERAGTVGKGLNAVLAEIRRGHPQVAIHLVGHSFGARVVTAAADGPDAFRPRSLTLLQAAFSHNGFSAKFDGSHDGFFRKIVSDRKIDGPIVITHTIYDKAVGVAYPLASRLSGDNRSAFGDRDDPFGGLGRNGAVRLSEAEVANGDLLPETGRYAFDRKVHNLRADAFISDHSAVTGPEVANALAQAIGTSAA